MGTIGRRLGVSAGIAAIIWLTVLVHTALAQEAEQIPLTDQHIGYFIKAQKDLATIAPKIQDAGEQPDPAIQAELEQIATRHGFKSFSELDNVAANISMVMSGLDNDTGDYVDPVQSLKKELEDIKSDSEIPEADKKQLIEELTEAIKVSTPLKYPENVEIVKRHQADLEAALE